MQHEYRLIIRVPRLLDTNKKEEKEGLVETSKTQQTQKISLSHMICVMTFVSAIMKHLEKFGQNPGVSTKV